MGLLQHILQEESAASEIEISGGGLLAKAECLFNERKNNFDFFYSWAEQHNFAHIGIFSYIHNRYVLCFAYNINAETIVQSISTDDFWRGILSFPDNKWETFFPNSIDFSKFYQFFSDDPKNQLTSVNLLKIPLSQNGTEEDKSSFLLSYTLEPDEQQNLVNLSDASLDQFSAILKDIGTDNPLPTTAVCDHSVNNSKGLLRSNAHFIIMPLEPVIDAVLGNIEISDATIKERIADCVFNETCYYLSKAFAFPNYITVDKDYKIKIILFASEIPDAYLFQLHITKILSVIFHSGSADLKLLVVNTSSNSEEIKKFVLQD